ncbi:hypothetical protein [Sulfurirhabdus autotrophica]|uniref:Uncharacterized protein n=1 Tax=Sulfurirhabdus autotrophica TaxID=1706046 RepID=A0A4R3XTG7_9PROT|nr:hypothetical protein [Sulfurirhabdus autotrophica]TCV81283.1 hypothetical protein EDC63_12432 [Sulfurirhabdus autotrophica]
MVFDSLTKALEDWFDTPLEALPEMQKKRVETDFFPIPWSDLSPDQRRSVAAQLDYQHDPATEKDREFWWEFFEHKAGIKKAINNWETISAPTASDLDKKETRLAELRRELTVMEQKERNSRGNYLVHWSKRPKASPTSDKAVYIPYPKTLKLLSDRLNASPEEIATWIWMGPNEGGLAAYMNANELETPQRFYFDYFMGTDYLAPLMACWFLADDVSNFQPNDRYITGKTLIERWSKQPGIQPEAYIRAKITESRLLDLHPTMGGTQWTRDETWPPKETALFLLTHVAHIEIEDFGEDVTKKLSSSDLLPVIIKPSGHLNHDLQMQQRANEIATEIFTSTKRLPTKDKVANKLALELKISVDTVLRRIRVEWKIKSPPKFQIHPK